MPYTILLLQSQLSKQMRNTGMVDGMDKIPHSYVKTFFPHISFFFSKQYTLAVHRNVYIRESCFNHKLELIFNIVNSKVNICTYTVIWFPLLMKVNCTKTREITALKSASHLQETINYL